MCNVFRKIRRKLAQLAQNSGWYTSQVANTGLTKPLKPVFAPFLAKCMIPKKADSPPGSATSYHPLRPFREGRFSEIQSLI
jgi:hypothetical protein